MSQWFICGGCLSDLPLEGRVFLIHRCGHGCGYCSACAVVRSIDPCLACDRPREFVPLSEPEHKEEEELPDLGPCEAWLRPTYDVAPRQCSSYATRLVGEKFLCGNHTIKISPCEITMLPPPFQFKVFCNANIPGRRGRPMRRCGERGVIDKPLTLCERHAKELKRK